MTTDTTSDAHRAMTDGGEPLAPELFAAWDEKAAENIDEWGLQDKETLLLAIQEELGELTQAHLEAEHEDGSPARLSSEIDDLGALLIQLSIRQRRDYVHEGAGEVGR